MQIIGKWDFPWLRTQQKLFFGANCIKNDLKQHWKLAQIYEKEKEILIKEKEKLELSIERRKKLLSNDNYVNKAPANVVENDRIQLEKEEQKLKEILLKIN